MTTKKQKTIDTENENEKDESIPMTPEDMKDEVAKSSILPFEKGVLYEGTFQGMHKLPGKGYDGKDAFYCTITLKGNDFMSRFWSIYDLNQKYALKEIEIGDTIRFKRIDNSIVLME